MPLITIDRGVERRAVALRCTPVIPSESGARGQGEEACCALAHIRYFQPEFEFRIVPKTTPRKPFLASPNSIATPWNILAARDDTPYARAAAVHDLNENAYCRPVSLSAVCCSSLLISVPATDIQFALIGAKCGHFRRRWYWAGVRCKSCNCGIGACADS